MDCNVSDEREGRDRGGGNRKSIQNIAKKNKRNVCKRVRRWKKIRAKNSGKKKLRLGRFLTPPVAFYKHRRSRWYLDEAVEEETNARLALDADDRALEGGLLRP